MMHDLTTPNLPTAENYIKSPIRGFHSLGDQSAQVDYFGVLHDGKGSALLLLE